MYLACVESVTSFLDEIMMPTGCTVMIIMMYPKEMMNSSGVPEATRTKIASSVQNPMMFKESTNRERLWRAQVG